MAVEEEVIEEDLDDEVEEQAPEVEDREPESESVDEDPDEEEDRVVVTLGEDPEEEEEHEEAPAWVKKVRKSNRRLESENRKLKRELLERSTERAPKVELGEKPTLKSAKYDDKLYEQQLADYYDRKRKIDEQQAALKKTTEAQTKQWEERNSRYVAQKAAHNFRDFEEAEELVTNSLNVAQQSIIVQGAEDAALLVYALGNNPKKLEELAAVKNPVDFAVKLGKLESQLKVTKKKAPAPEKRISGKTGGLGGGGDATLARLREKAEKSGDYSEVLAYKRRSREQSQ